MTKRLTLSLDKETIELAKCIATENNTTVSKLFEKLIKEHAEKRERAGR